MTLIENSFTIDASKKTLGRVCTEIANLLRGKNKADFAYNKLCGSKVIVINANNIKLSGRKIDQKKYARHSGYLGNLKFESVKDLLANKPEEVIKRAVYGMLPNNKLKKEWMKNLKICRLTNN